MQSMEVSAALGLPAPRVREPSRPDLALARSLWLVRRALSATREASRRPARDPKSKARALRRLALDVCAAHAIRPRLNGRLPSRPVILVANHLSYVDPIVIASIVPCAPIAKGEIAHWPLIGDAIRELGVLFVRRGDAGHGARTLRRALRLLQAGVSILNFPEGTTSDGPVGAFRRGIFGLARLARVPVLPLGIRFDSKKLCWTGGALFLPHYLKTAARAASAVRIEVGQVLDPTRYAHAEALACDARRSVIELSARGRS
jgi:lyso-ornithine lipid O-acyltransferase